MSTNIIHKKTAVSGRAPSTSQLQYAELAINTVDGKIYLKINDGSDRIIDATSERFVFDVANNGAGAYAFSGSGLSSVDNATLFLYRGFTYEFHLNATGHPFYIKTVASTGTGNQYTSGVTGQGTETGIVTFTVPQDAPDTLYYACEFHSSMQGMLKIVDQGVNFDEFSVSTASPSGSGSLTYNNAGVFTYTPPSFALGDLNNVSSAAPTTGEVLKWDGSQWAPGTDATAGGAGLDADTLDGQDGTYYLNYNNFTNTPTIPSVLTDLSITDGTSGQVLTTDGAGNFTFTTVSGGGGIALTDLSVTTGSATAGGALLYDNTTGVFTFRPDIQVSSIDDLSDVDTTTSAPTNGQALVWDGTNFVPGTVASSIASIDDLNDVDTTTTAPTDGQVLAWNASSSQFLPITVSGGGVITTIDTIGDVDTTTNAPTNGQVLVWDGTNWVPGTASTVGSIDDLTDVDITTNAPTIGQTLKWDGSNFVPDDDLNTGGGGGGVTYAELSVLSDSFTGDGTTTTYTLSQLPSTENHVIVALNGVVQDPSEYSISGQDLIFVTAPALNDNVELRSFKNSSTEVELRDYQVYKYTITSDVTSVSGADDNALTLTYDVGKVEVYVNGVRIVNGDDYSATNGTSIAFNQTVFNGSVVEVVSLSKTTIFGGLTPIDGDQVSIASTNVTAVSTFAASSFRTAKYIIQMSHASAGYHSTEVLVIHDGTTVYMTEYATIYTNASLGTVDASIISGNVTITVTPTNTNTDVRTKRLSVEV